MSKKIYVHLASGFEETEAITVIDLLKRAGYDVTMVSITGFPVVNSAHDIPITADQLIEDVSYDDVDMILLPGGMPGAENLNKHELLKEKIQEFYDSGKYLAAICAAPFVFGEMGLLEGRNVTCYPGFEHRLNGADYKGTKLEVSGNIITSKGVGTAIDFGLKIIEIFSGKDAAKEMAEQVVYETN